MVGLIWRLPHIPIFFFLYAAQPTNHSQTPLAPPGLSMVTHRAGACAKSPHLQAALRSFRKWPLRSHNTQPRTSREFLPNYTDFLQVSVDLPREEESMALFVFRLFDQIGHGLPTHSRISTTISRSGKRHGHISSTNTYSKFSTLQPWSWLLVSHTPRRCFQVPFSLRQCLPASFLFPPFSTLYVIVLLLLRLLLIMSFTRSLLFILHQHSL